MTDIETSTSRDDEPVARRPPVLDRPDRLTPEQRAALARLLALNWPPDIERFDREAAYSERLSGSAEKAEFRPRHHVLQAFDGYASNPR
ncbi:MAG: hypothetical protein U1E45_03950 [Geminicoccaceae bacterium]